MTTDLIKINTDSNNRPTTTSLNVAEVFGKRHRNVLRDIETLDCSEGFNALNFEPIYWTDSRNRRQSGYEMTRDGFTFLVMGYRGKKAAAFKEAYINEFNQMEEYIRNQQQTPAMSKPEMVLESMKWLTAEVERLKPNLYLRRVQGIHRRPD